MRLRKCIDSALAYSQERTAILTGGNALVKIPEVRWEDVGGMDLVREQIEDMLASVKQTPHNQTISEATSSLMSPTTNIQRKSDNVDIQSLEEKGKRAFVNQFHLSPTQLPFIEASLNSTGVRDIDSSTHNQHIQKRSGILFYGPPGTGKTLIAKAVATEAGLNFLSVKGPELLSMYIGESEKKVREVFQQASQVSPCVLFFDELDSLAPARGSGESSGVMERVVSQLLTEIDAVNSTKSNVLLIGATNRPDLLDSSLLRPGRLDRCVYLGPAVTIQGKTDILRALTRKFRLHSDVDLTKIVEKCPEGATGADMFALASDAMLIAVKKSIDTHIQDLSIFNQHAIIPKSMNEYLNTLTEKELQVVVHEDDFMEALQHLTPSLSKEELEHYAKLQRQFASTRKRD